MRIVGLKEDLIKGSQPACNVISPRATIPILTNILIETQKDRVRFVGTDLEIGVSSTVPIKVQEGGSITTPAKKFMEIIRELPQGEVKITTQKNNALTIESGRAFFKIMGLPQDEFPKLPKFEEGEIVVISQPLLKKALNMTSFAISHDETRYILRGILFILSKKQLKLVATDGRRLALVQRDLGAPTPTEKEVIVPAKTINELNRTLGDDGQVKITFSQDQIMFKLDDIYIISRLIEGHFPNYEQVIPPKSKNRAKILKGELLQVVKRASLLTSQASQSVRFELFKDKILASSQSPDMGEAREEMDIAYDGDEMMIGFNPTYLMDILKNIDPDEVVLELTDPEKPGVIRGEAGDYIYVIMPMQLT